MILSITTLCIECHYGKCHYAECHVSFIVMLNIKFAECRYAEYHYAVCRYADYHYAECHYPVCCCTVKQLVSASVSSTASFSTTVNYARKY